MTRLPNRLEPRTLEAALPTTPPPPPAIAVHPRHLSPIRYVLNGYDEEAPIAFSDLLLQHPDLCLVTVAQLWDPAMDVGKVIHALEIPQRRFGRSTFVVATIDPASRANVHLGEIMRRLSRAGTSQILVPSPDLVKHLKIAATLKPCQIVNGYVLIKNGRRVTDWTADPKVPDQGHHWGWETITAFRR